MGPQDPNLKQERLLASSFVHSFTPSFGGYFLSAYSMPGTMKCRRENRDQVRPSGAHGLVREAEIIQVIRL